MARDRDFSKCRRCGKTKPPPRSNSTALCVECEGATSCEHFRHGGLDPTCEAGVDIKALTAPMEGSGLRRPCYFIHGGTPVACDKFSPIGEAACHERDAGWAKQLQRMALVMPIVGKVKEEHRGKNWRGDVECPACGGRLALSHSAFNGHVWGQCSTDGCVSWME